MPAGGRSPLPPPGRASAVRESAGGPRPTLGFRGDVLRLAGPGPDVWLTVAQRLPTRFSSNTPIPGVEIFDLVLPVLFPPLHASSVVAAAYRLWRRTPGRTASVFANSGVFRHMVLWQLCPTMILSCCQIQ